MASHADADVMPTGTTLRSLEPYNASIDAPVVLDSRIEKRITRKLDMTLIPTLWLLMIVSFADRSNIGKFSQAHSYTRDC